MNIVKLQEAVRELIEERDKIDQAVRELQGIIKKLSNGHVTPAPPEIANPDGRLFTHVYHAPFVTQHRPNRRSAESYVTIAAHILREQNRPIHIDELVTKISEAKGAKEGEITRASVEASLIRAIKTPAWHEVIKKTGPGTFSVGPNQIKETAQ